MTKRIIVELLGMYPQIKVDGQPVLLSDPSLELFIYIVMNDVPRYERNNLVDTLYHPEDILSYADPKTYLSKVALANIPDKLAEICLKYKNQPAITYDNAEVWVDALAFKALSEGATSVFGEAILPEQLEKLSAAEKQYTGDLVAGYKSDKRNIDDWLATQRNELRTKYHSVLEQLTRHYTVQQRYEQAHVLADKWHGSAPDNLIPLQYLVWLNAKRNYMGRVRKYLADMDTLEQTQSVLLGKSAEDWRVMFEQNREPSLEDIRLNGKPTYSPTELRKIASQYVMGYGNQLVHIFDQLIVNPTDHFCLLVGGSGSGKSAIAEAVGLTWHELNNDYVVIQMDVTRDTSADDLLNEMATALDKPFLLDLMYENKRQSVFELLRHDTHLLIFDQEEPGDIFSDEIKAFIKRTSEYASVLACSEHHWNSVADAVTIDAVSLSNINTIIRNMRPDAVTIDIQPYESDIVELVAGKHEKLLIAVNAIDMQDRSFAETIQAMKRITDDDPVLSWLWHALNVDQRHVLMVIGLFDVVQRPTVKDIVSIMGASPAQCHMALKVLSDKHVIRMFEDRVRIIGVLYQYINAHILSDPENSPIFEDCQARFMAHFLDFLAANIDAPNVLDSQRRNLIKAYHLAFANNTELDLELFSKFLRYLNGRGAGVQLNGLLQYFEHLDVNWRTLEAIEIRRIIADIARARGDKDKAVHLLNTAIQDARRLDDDLMLAHLYQSLANATYGLADEQYKAHLEAAKDHALASEDAHVLSYVYASLGREAWSRSENKLAVSYLEQSLEFAKGLDLLIVENFAATTLALIALNAHDYVRAQEYLNKAHKISVRMGNVERVAYGQLNQAALYNLQRQPERAMPLLDQALITARNIQNQYLESNVIRNMGRTQLLFQNRLQAEQQLRLALMMSQSQNDRRMKAAILIDLGRFAFTYSAWSNAYAYYRRALCNADLISHNSLAAEAFYGLCMTGIMDHSIIELDPVEQTLSYLVDDLRRELTQLNNVTITREHLLEAERYFRTGPENVPQLQHVSIVEPIVRLFL